MRFWNFFKPTSLEKNLEFKFLVCLCLNLCDSDILDVLVIAGDKAGKSELVFTHPESQFMAMSVTDRPKVSLNCVLADISNHCAEQHAGWNGKFAIFVPRRQ